MLPQPIIANSKSATGQLSISRADRVCSEASVVAGVALVDRQDDDLVKTSNCARIVRAVEERPIDDAARVVLEREP